MTIVVPSRRVQCRFTASRRFVGKIKGFKNTPEREREHCDCYRCLWHTAVLWSKLVTVQLAGRVEAGSLEHMAA